MSGRFGIGEESDQAQQALLNAIREINELKNLIAGTNEQITSAEGKLNQEIQAKRKLEEELEEVKKDKGYEPKESKLPICLLQRLFRKCGMKTFGAVLGQSIGC